MKMVEEARGPKEVKAKDLFFDIMDGQRIALTFEEVRLKTGYCETKPDDVLFKTKFSRRVPLKIPIVSAAMDTVTEWKMAVAIAKLGGLGVIHNNLSAKEQAEQVKSVRYHLSGLIERPITALASDTVEHVLNWLRAHNRTFHSFPVVDENGRLVGVLGHNDFDFCRDVTLPVSAVMTKDVITAPAGTTLDQAYEIMIRSKKKTLPLVDKQYGVAGMYVFSDVARNMSGSSAMYNVDDRGQLRCAAAVGIGDDAFQRIELFGRHVAAVVLDKAHADFRDYLWTLREIKRHDQPFDVVCGNISEPESAKRLVDAGADGIKVGQGPGSICTTRKVAGIGCPQVTAVHNCEKVIRGSGVPICADGGIAFSGDIPVAIGAGADSVMLGRLLAGTKEAPGDVIHHVVGVRSASGEVVPQMVAVKVYRGMGSLEAMQERLGSSARYNQSGPAMKVPEGIKGAVPYQGEVEEVVYQLIGGLRAGMTYIGAATIAELQAKADFRRITSAGERESHTHDVIMLAEPPNYRRSGI